MKLPWKKQNARAQQVAAEFARLVAMYQSELSEANRNTVARHINRRFMQNVSRRRNKTQVLAKTTGSSPSRSSRSNMSNMSNRSSKSAFSNMSRSRIPSIRRTNSWMRTDNAAPNWRYNARKNWHHSPHTTHNNSRHVLSANMSGTRYAARSTNERVVY